MKMLELMQPIAALECHTKGAVCGSVRAGMRTCLMDRLLCGKLLLLLLLWLQQLLQSLRLKISGSKACNAVQTLRTFRPKALCNRIKDGLIGWSSLLKRLAKTRRGSL